MTNYVASPSEQVADHVRRYEASGGKDGGDMMGFSVVIVTHKGKQTGATRKTPVIRVADGDRYLLIGSKGGAPENPNWVHNLRANPDDVTVQDKDRVIPMRVREVKDEAERKPLWEIAVKAFPNYAQYQTKTTRVIPVFLAEPK
jgi:deazaflavin-dependent oxidoreductase (nitroreductase family)